MLPLSCLSSADVVKGFMCVHVVINTQTISCVVVFGVIKQSGMKTHLSLAAVQMFTGCLMMFRLLWRRFLHLADPSVTQPWKAEQNNVSVWT